MTSEPPVVGEPQGPQQEQEQKSLVRRFGPVRLIAACVLLAGVALATIGAARGAWSLGISFGD